MALLFLLVVLALLAFTAWLSYLALVFWILLVVMGTTILSGLSVLMFLLGLGVGSALQSAPLGLALGALFVLVFWACLGLILQARHTRNRRTVAAIQTSSTAPDRN
jgi:hypothetical protein